MATRLFKCNRCGKMKASKDLVRFMIFADSKVGYRACRSHFNKEYLKEVDAQTTSKKK